MRVPHWIWGGLAALLIAGIVLWQPVADAVFSVRLGMGLLKVGSGTAEKNLSTVQTTVLGQENGRKYKALLYYRENSPPRAAVILVAGLSELGCYHPRVVAMSRLLADMGLLVLTPDIQEFRDFQISAEPIGQILFWYKQVPGLKQAAAVRKTGLAGVSFSGTLALMAAARAEIRDSVGFVAAVGPYSNLMRCTQSWFAAAPGPAAAYYPTRFYAKWIIMRSALGMIAATGDRAFLHNVLDNLLLQKKVSPPPSGLSTEAARWYELATMAENRTDQGLTDEIESYLVSRIYPQLDPEKALTDLRCPVFLIHGAFDDLIPPEESLELKRKIPGSRLLVSPFLTHTHPSERPLSRVDQFSAAFDTLAFFYQFARAVR